MNTAISTFDHAGLIQGVYRAIWDGGGQIYNAVEATDNADEFRAVIDKVVSELHKAISASRRMLEDIQKNRRLQAKDGIRVEDPRSRHFEIVVAKAEEIAYDLSFNLVNEVAESFESQDFCSFLEVAFDMTGMDPAQVVHRALYP